MTRYQYSYQARLENRAVTNLASPIDGPESRSKDSRECLCSARGVEALRPDYRTLLTRDRACRMRVRQGGARCPDPMKICESCWRAIVERTVRTLLVIVLPARVAACAVRRSAKQNHSTLRHSSRRRQRVPFRYFLQREFFVSMLHLKRWRSIGHDLP